MARGLGSWSGATVPHRGCFAIVRCPDPVLDLLHDRRRRSVDRNSAVAAPARLNGHKRTVVLANVIGWTVAAAAVAWADTFTRTLGIRGIGGALIYLGVVASGGVALGLATGFAMRTRR